VQMRYSIALNDVWVFEQQPRLVVVAEISHTRAEHDWHKIDTNLVDQASTERLSREVAGAQRHVFVARKGLCPGHGALYPLGHEAERRVWKGPVGGRFVRDNEDCFTHSWTTVPSIGQIEQTATDDVDSDIGPCRTQVFRAGS